MPLSIRSDGEMTRRILQEFQKRQIVVEIDY